ncbi:hypothetical protein C2I18_15435 [Paenibacillus sp. PK3_47]|nr:hypothetical protein C2I18_15435 [Paenibacillus sp. PK3_47]
MPILALLLGKALKGCGEQQQQARAWSTGGSGKRPPGSAGCPRQLRGQQHKGQVEVNVTEGKFGTVGALAFAFVYGFPPRTAV